jgi:hypothetical protein
VLTFCKGVEGIEQHLHEGFIYCEGRLLLLPHKLAHKIFVQELLCVIGHRMFDNFVKMQLAGIEHSSLVKQAQVDQDELILLTHGAIIEIEHMQLKLLYIYCLLISL